MNIIKLFSVTKYILNTLSWKITVIKNCTLEKLVSRVCSRFQTGVKESHWPAQQQLSLVLLIFTYSSNYCTLPAGYLSFHIHLPCELQPAYLAGHAPGAEEITGIQKTCYQVYYTQLPLCLFKIHFRIHSARLGILTVMVTTSWHVYCM